MGTLDIALVFRRRGSSSSVPPPSPPVSFEILISEVDGEEETQVEPSSSGFLGLALAIDYIDSRGQESHRRITVHRIETRPRGIYLRAFCHERRAPRLFKAGSVRTAVDLSTGEVLEEPSALQSFFERLAAYDERELDDPTSAVLTRLRPGILILLFLARCDGVEHPSELEVILDYLDQDCAPPGLHIPKAKEGLARINPDEESFHRAVSRLASEDPEELVRVARFVKRLIEADGAITETEAAFAIDLASVMEDRAS